jgi:RNA polymerase subunit RPABC4/transcription elongation factor Spt4
MNNLEEKSMIFLKMRCASCRGVFDIHQGQLEPEKPEKCPFCGTEIPKQQWSGLVECFHSVANWNRNAVKSAAAHGTPLFTAEIRQHYVRRERSEE